jgi:AraC-like DNA-binding protein
MVHHDIFSFVILLGVIQGVFLSFFFLWRKSGNQRSNVFLGFILLFFALLNFDFWSGYTLTTLRYPHLLDISVPFTLTMGPLIYQYTRHYLLIKRDKHLMLHYMPALCCVVYSLFFYLQGASFKYNVFIQSRSLDFPLKMVSLQFSPDPWRIRNYIGIFVSVQLIVYLILSFHVYYLFKKGKAEAAKNIALQGIHWLRNTLISAFIIIIVATIIQLFYPGGRVEYILAVCFTLFIYFTSLQLIRNSDFFKQGHIHEKYIKSSLNNAMTEDLVKRIDAFIIHDKPFLNNLFSLKSFSRSIEASPNHLSQVLNEHYGLTFFEFVASYRIGEAKHILGDPKNADMKIEQIAYKVGYNSKAAFNKAFKIDTGQTPQEYKKSCLS